ncbi:MAG: hypothetical protein AB7O97_23275 [Planctomycetota bacterium]
MRDCLARVTFAILCAAGTLAAQTTWTVDLSNRPGTDFVDIQSAVDAAASGDVIRIRAAGAPADGVPSHLVYLAPVIDGKGLTLIGEGSDNGPTSTWMRGLLWVRNLQAGQIVRCSDFVIWESDLVLGAPGSGMRLENNQGVILIQKVRVEAKGTSPLPWTLDCRLVVLQGVEFVARPAALAALRSNLVIQDSILSSVRGVLGQPGPPLALTDCRLWMMHSSAVGKDGTSQSAATPAVGAQATELFFGPGSYLQGGLGPTGRQFALQVSLVGGVPTVSHIDPGASFLGLIGGQWTIEPVPTLRATTTASTLTIDHWCTPQVLVVLAAGPLLPTPVSSAEGLVAIDPLPGIAWLAFGPASGQLQWTFPAPPGLPADFVLGLQAAELRPDGTLGLTDLALVTGR